MAEELTKYQRDHFRDPIVRAKLIPIITQEWVREIMKQHYPDVTHKSDSKRYFRLYMGYQREFSSEKPTSLYNRSDWLQIVAKLDKSAKNTLTILDNLKNKKCL